jgi:hypothetical protein
VIEQATRDVLTAVHAVADRVQPPENSRVMLAGIASVMIAEALKADSAVTPDVINQTWAERGFPWRMVRLQ